MDRGAEGDHTVVTSHPRAKAGTLMPRAHIIGRTEVGARMRPIRATGNSNAKAPPKKNIPAKKADATKAMARRADVSGAPARSSAFTATMTGVSKKIAVASQQSGKQSRL